MRGYARADTAARAAAFFSALSLFSASTSKLRKMRMPESTCFSSKGNGVRNRSTVSCVTLINKPLASAPSKIGFPGTVNCRPGLHPRRVFH